MLLIQEIGLNTCMGNIMIQSYYVWSDTLEGIPRDIISNGLLKDVCNGIYWTDIDAGNVICPNDRWWGLEEFRRGLTVSFKTPTLFNLNNGVTPPISTIQGFNNIGAAVDGSLNDRLYSIQGMLSDLGLNNPSYISGTRYSEHYLYRINDTPVLMFTIHESIDADLYDIIDNLIENFNDAKVDVAYGILVLENKMYFYAWDTRNPSITSNQFGPFKNYVSLYVNSGGLLQAIPQDNTPMPSVVNCDLRSSESRSYAAVICGLMVGTIMAVVVGVDVSGLSEWYIP